MKIFKRIAIGITALVIIFVAAYAYYGVRTFNEMKVMKPANTGEIVDGISVIKDNFNNMYIIKGTDGYIAIDSAADPSIVERELGKLEIPADKVKAVLLTHTDSDHTGSIGLFENAKVYISDAEEQMVNGKTARTLVVIKSKLDHRYELLKEGQEIELASLKIKCVLTPGHTPGSMSYIINDKYLFTGDTFSLKDGKAAVFNEFFNMDSGTEMKSIEKLSGLKGIEGIFTAHYGYTMDFVTAFKDVG
ncbi:MAG TPA: MBL fold metallo-hydrolase [Clostridia bacterium]|nr:MBL fold metallo-hydrolase [Clostridia bacterium]